MYKSIRNLICLWFDNYIRGMIFFNECRNVKSLNCYETCSSDALYLSEGIPPPSLPPILQIVSSILFKSFSCLPLILCAITEKTEISCVKLTPLPYHRPALPDTHFLVKIVLESLSLHGYRDILQTQKLPGKTIKKASIAFRIPFKMWK